MSASEVERLTKRVEQLASALRAVGAMPIEVILADGTVPVIGQRVVTALDKCKRSHMAHGHNESVHEITNIFQESRLIECGPTQIDASHLRLAPEGSTVTCFACAGWRDQLTRMRIDAEAYRAMQVNAFGSAARKLIPSTKRDAFDRAWVGLLDEAATKAGLSCSGARATAEIEWLRKAIEAAPHVLCTRGATGQVACTCWKRDALETK